MTLNNNFSLDNVFGGTISLRNWVTCNFALLISHTLFQAGTWSVVLHV